MAIRNAKRAIFNPKSLVKHALSKRTRLLNLVKNHKTPYFVYDKDELLKSIQVFNKSFKKHIPNVEVYYAVKANPYKKLLKDVVKNGLGLDVSSGSELKSALQVGSKKILFTGPAKTKEELTLALRYSDRVTLNIDSFTEFEKLKILVKQKDRVRVGVRISPSQNDKWSKFGIPLGELAVFWKELERHEAFSPIGIQIHTSWNETADKYIEAINMISNFLKKNPHMKQELQFIDLGGGFLSYNTEGLHSQSLAEGKLSDVHFESPALPIQRYAKEIGNEIKKKLSDIECSFYFEPGRIICNNAMHILLRVEDIKRSNIVITDGGTNMIGWERFEEEYCPIINLSRPSQKERKATIYGALCTPHDVWGYFYHGEEIKEGDILVIPYQGAYTYSYAQHFIKSFPEVYPL